jgi:hypothetical protein
MTLGAASAVHAAGTGAGYVGEGARTLPEGIMKPCYHSRIAPGRTKVRAPTEPAGAKMRDTRELARQALWKHPKAPWSSPR